MGGGTLTPGELVARLGPHPARRWGLDLATDAGLARWLVGACLIAARGGEESALAAREELVRRGLDAPAAIAEAGFAPLAAALAAAHHPEFEKLAALLVRASASLEERYAGSLSTPARAADDLESLAGGFAQLAPGIGRATVAELLRPLRDIFSAAREVPLAPAAHAAARCLGWLREGEDEDGEPGALRAVLARDPSAPELADVEAALARLGRAACRRSSGRSCPLGRDCALTSRAP